MTGWVRSRLDRTGALVAAIALMAYLPGFWWGAPTATAADRVLSWGVDDSSPLGPLAEVHNIVQPKPDRNLGYPLFHDFVAAAAVAPYLLGLGVTGGLHGVGTTYPYGLEDPVTALRVLTLINHAVSVVFGVIVVVAAWSIGRTLWDAGTGLLSAAFVLTLYPMFYYARTGNVDVPMLALVALTLAALAHALVHGMTLRRAVWVGLFAGLALATKEAAIGTILPAALLVLVLGWREGGWKVPALAFAASVAALGLGSGLLVDPHRWVAHIRFLTGRISDVPGATTLTSAYPYTAGGHLALGGAMLQRLVETMTVPGLVLGLGGIVAAAWRDRRAALFALALPGYLLVAFVALRSAQLRYVLPAAFVLALFAGWAVAFAWRQGAAARAGIVAAAVLALGLQVLHDVSLTWEMLHDSRYAAARWIAGRVRPGDRVDFFGASDKLPPIPRGVVTAMATPWHGMWAVQRADSAVADSIRGRWRALRPALVLVIPDHSSRPGLPYDASMPPSLYASLLGGGEHYRLAAFFQTAPLLAAIPRPPLDYPSVNPPIRIFAPDGAAPACHPACD